MTRLLTSPVVKEFKRTHRHNIQGFKYSGSTYGGQVSEVTCRLQEKRIHWRA